MARNNLSDADIDAAFMESEAQGEAIRLIGELRAGGMAMRAIADEMHQRGHSGPMTLMAFAYAGERFGVDSLRVPSRT
jgi:hypothetical protein